MDCSYGSKAYWDARYEKESERELLTDEWLLSYRDIEPILSAALGRIGGKHSRVLDVGCGNSKLLADMRLAGHTGELVCIDISGIAAAEKACFGHNVRVLEVDARTCFEDGTFGENSFDAVIDKSTVDAMLCDEDNGMDNVRRYAQQVNSILCGGGCFFVISHNSPTENHAVDDIDDNSDGGDGSGSDSGEVKAEEDESVAEWLQVIISGLTSPPNSNNSTPSSGSRLKRNNSNSNSVNTSEGRSSWHLDVHTSGEQASAPSCYVFTKIRRTGRTGRIGRMNLKGNKRSRGPGGEEYRGDPEGEGDGDGDEEGAGLLHMQVHEH